MSNRIRKQQEEAPGEGRKGGGRLPRALIAILNGSFLTRERVLANMGFLLFVAGLMLVHIAYGYYTERTVRDLQRTGTELRELRSEYITVRSHLERTEQQSQVAEDIGGLGLRESRVPPYKIKVDPDELEHRP
ncbi:MAG: FtsL-like putative cell division protein [Flavobacteriales bacterium]|nr:hypothetical protein [Flavobacteriales bacterium]MCB0810784.1 hypothetical protein [Flavobacteriales bacterium]MCB0817290.1 hypothetical protein [Flavobacteriales bacterium]HOP42161.1 FtsL-like putative cell division protein [Flavobacteriales bacterium]HPF66794.1 FtsL-like putative cell division protein [Flavobacteriales bacterium]